MEDNFRNTYWQKRLGNCAKALEKNGFEVHIAESRQQAGEIAWQIIDNIAPASIGIGDSITMRSTGITERVAADTRWKYIDGFDKNRPREENLKIRREALLSELFIVGANAVSADGKLFWLDMIGNRIAPISFGPYNVIVFIGRNKLTATQEEAIARIKETAAPLNAIRHTNLKTPCQATGKCHNCASPDRICNSWLIMEKCFPQKRLKVILINEE